jgi:hypothetical protein
MRIASRPEKQIESGEEFMRKLVATALFIGIAAMPTQALAQPRWYRGSNTEVKVYIEKTRVSATNWSWVKKTGAKWANSGRIKVVFTRKCPQRIYCVKVYDGRWNNNRAGWATVNYDPRTNYAWYGSLHLNNRYLTSSAARRKTTCHELGHVFGLQHRKGGRTCMRDGFTTMYGHPDTTDYLNLKKIYRHP